MMWPLVVYFAFVMILVAAVLAVSYLLGPRHSEPATGEPYEGGIVSEGSARVRFSLRYNLVAMFFVVFDLEAVFLFAWAELLVNWAGPVMGESALRRNARRGSRLHLEDRRAGLGAETAPFEVKI